MCDMTCIRSRLGFVGLHSGAPYSIRGRGRQGHAMITAVACERRHGDSGIADTFRATFHHQQKVGDNDSSGRRGCHGLAEFSRCVGAIGPLCARAMIADKKFGKIFNSLQNKMF